MRVVKRVQARLFLLNFLLIPYVQGAGFAGSQQHRLGAFSTDKQFAQA
jgi:hypothetical protein